jgi:hypothetical protein
MREWTPITPRLSAAALFAAVVVATACGGDDPVDPQQNIDLTGRWDFEIEVSNSTYGVTCEGGGILDIDQTGSTFSGTSDASGSCETPVGAVPITGGVTIADGTIDGRQVSFAVTPCIFEGAVSASDPDLVSGTVACEMEQGALTVEATGTWRAERTGG